jgi:hypothetical protein
MFKKLIGIVLAISTALPASSFASGEAVGIPQMPGKGYFGIDANPAFLNKFTTPALSGREVDSSRVIKSVRNCKSLTDPACANANFFKADTLLPLCESDLDMNCIESVGATDSSGKVLQVNTGGKFPGVRPKDYVGDSSAQLPSGGQAPVVEIPEAAHEGGNKYVVIINPSGVVDRRGFNQDSGKFVADLQGGIFAIKTIGGNFRLGGQSENLADFQVWGAGREGVGVGGGGDTSYGCLINDASMCAVPQEMPLDITFTLKMRYNFKVVNWFSGRLASPIVDIESIPTGGNLLTITANASQVPLISRWVKKTELPNNLLDYYKTLPQPLGGTGDWSGAAQSGDPSSWSLMRDFTSFNQQMMDEFLLWLPVISDKSDYLPTLWTFRSMNSGGFNDSCLRSSDRVVGIVSTNASLYIEGPPVFNRQTMSLEYKVAAPHYAPSGELFKGTYDLQVLSSSARCLYGFSNAPISATIEIVSESGEKQIAVTTVTERNGWLYLSAKGFSFSAPVVNVKLTQQATIKAPAKKTSITCVKGKTSKKVSAVNPKCPTGYKKAK